MRRYVVDPELREKMPGILLSSTFRQQKLESQFYVVVALILGLIFCILWSPLVTSARIFSRIRIGIFTWAGWKRIEDWEKFVPAYNPGTDIKRRRLSFDGKAKTQSVLWKLPLEIRQQIYAECVSGYNIRVSLNKIDAFSDSARNGSRRFMQHTRCKHLPASTCVCFFSRSWRFSGVDEWGVGSLLSLLKVCRRM
jgi:hypothetical protein